MMTQSNIKIIKNYTARSFVLTGDTKPYKEELKNMYGKYNSNLKCGPGWVFSNKRLQQVSDFIENVKNIEKSETPKVVIKESTDDDNSDSEWLPEDNKTDDESETESFESECDCVLIDNLRSQIKELKVSNNKLVKDINKKDKKIKKFTSKICKLKTSLIRRNIEKFEVKSSGLNKYEFFMLLIFIGICLVDYLNVDVKENSEFIKEKISNKFESMYKSLNYTYRNFDYNYFNYTYRNFDYNYFNYTYRNFDYNYFNNTYLLF